MFTFEAFEIQIRFDGVKPFHISHYEIHFCVFTFEAFEIQIRFDDAPFLTKKCYCTPRFFIKVCQSIIPNLRKSSIILKLKNSK